MSDHGRRSIPPKPVIIAVLIVGTIAASVLISALVIDADPAGSKLPQSIEFVYKSSNAPAHGLARIEATCPLGKIVTGGGSYADTVSATLIVLDNLPVRTGTRDAWRVRFSNKSDREIVVGSVAICATVTVPQGRHTQTPTQTRTARSP